MGYYDGVAGAEQADRSNRTLSEVPSTELSSLLATNLKQAYEIQRTVETILDRIAPQPPHESAGDEACHRGDQWVRGSL
jgi:hypothetical protein